MSERFKTACHECGVVVHIPKRPDASHYHCPRCRALLYRRGQPFSYIIVMAATAVVLFFPLTFLPILDLTIFGIETKVTLFRALWMVYEDGYRAIALLATLTGLLIPLGMMGLLLAILVPLRLGYRPRHVAHYYRLYEKARAWGMAEVYLVSIVVAIVKLYKMGTLQIGLGFYLFIFFFLTYYIATVWFNPEDIWFEDALDD